MFALAPLAIVSNTIVGRLTKLAILPIRQRAAVQELPFKSPSPFTNQAHSGIGIVL
jgi:hypothetical protein